MFRGTFYAFTYGQPTLTKSSEHVILTQHILLVLGIRYNGRGSTRSVSRTGSIHNFITRANNLETECYVLSFTLVQRMQVNLEVDGRVTTTGWLSC
jgi:hypothetical protein